MHEVSVKCSEFKPLPNGLCEGKWFNGFLWRRCYSCPYCPVNLCENCEHVGYSGPHMYCKLMSFKRWIPQSRAVTKNSGTKCPNYKRRKPDA